MIHDPGDRDAGPFQLGAGRRAARVADEAAAEGRNRFFFPAAVAVGEQGQHGIPLGPVREDGLDVLGFAATPVREVGEGANRGE